MTYCQPTQEDDHSTAGWKQFAADFYAPAPVGTFYTDANNSCSQVIKF